MFDDSSNCCCTILFAHVNMKTREQHDVVSHSKTLVVSPGEWKSKHELMLTSHDTKVWAFNIPLDLSTWLNEIICMFSCSDVITEYTMESLQLCLSVKERPVYPTLPAHWCDAEHVTCHMDSWRQPWHRQLTLTTSDAVLWRWRANTPTDTIDNWRRRFMPARLCFVVLLVKLL